MSKAIKTLGKIWWFSALGFFVICFLVGTICTVRNYKESKKEEEARIAEKKSMEKYRGFDFRYAWRGQIWIIDDDNIPLLEEPCPGMLEYNLLGYLAKKKTKCIIKEGSKVEITTTKGGGWKYVRVTPGNNVGWINGRMVKKAYEVEK